MLESTFKGLTVKGLTAAWFGVWLLAVTGCEAELRLEGVEATLAEPIRRTDQFLALERDGDLVVAFADHGVILEGDLSRGTLEWARKELPDPAPNFIDSTQCPDGQVYGLSFENAVWARLEAGWSDAQVTTEEQVQAIECDASGALWVTGAFGTLMRSTDGGAHWDDLSLYEDFTLTGIAFADADHGYSVGEFGTLIKTEDAGETWDMLDPIADDFYPLALHFSSADEGWVSGVLGLVFHTADGGVTWQRQETATMASIYGFAVAGEALFAFGDLGALLRYDDDGDRWVDQPSPEIPVHYAAAAALDNGLLMVGGWGVALEIPVGAPDTVDTMGGGF